MTLFSWGTNLNHIGFREDYTHLSVHTFTQQICSSHLCWNCPWVSLADFQSSAYESRLDVLYSKAHVHLVKKLSEDSILYEASVCLSRHYQISCFPCYISLFFFAVLLKYNGYVVHYTFLIVQFDEVLHMYKSMKSSPIEIMSISIIPQSFLMPLSNPFSLTSYLPSHPQATTDRSPWGADPGISVVVVIHVILIGRQGENRCANTKIVRTLSIPLKELTLKNKITNSNKSY